MAFLASTALASTVLASTALASTALALGKWCSALCVVFSPFIKMTFLWFSWQLGLGWLAWSTARFYSNNCAAAGLNGYISSLFTMGSPICLSAWFSHGAFVVAYITAFITAVFIVLLWVWNRITQNPRVKLLHHKINSLQKELNQTKGQKT